MRSSFVTWAGFLAGCLIGTGVLQATEQTLWTIGVTNGRFAAPSRSAKPDAVFELGKNTPADWPSPQVSGGADAPVNRLRFQMATLPAGYLAFRMHIFFMHRLPEVIHLEVNGKRGSFPVVPARAIERNSNEFWAPAYSKQDFEAILPREYLRQGANEIAIRFLGDGAPVYYDSLQLAAIDGAPPKPAPVVLPTVFYRREGNALLEITNVAIPFAGRADAGEVHLRAGGKAITAPLPASTEDFGERLVPLAVPALDGPSPYELRISTHGVTELSRGEYIPAKRWKLFVTFKIHDDVGYTDLQPQIREVHGRNTDQVLGFLDQFPFYRFNMETSWLAEDYLATRSPRLVNSFLKYAREGRLGVSATNHNLLTGLCTGEELYRSMYYSAGLKHERGVPMETASSADVPSHSWFMPTLLADAGVFGFAGAYNQGRSGMFLRGGPGGRPFYWEGADGSRVLTWLAFHYHQLETQLDHVNTVDRLSLSLPAFIQRFGDPTYVYDAIMVYGLYHDNIELGNTWDGLGQLVGQWNQKYEYPKLIPATDADFFRYVEEKFRKDIPVIRGDGGSYWEDGSASSARETAINRWSQAVLPAAEMLAAVASVLNPDTLYPAEDFRKAWRDIMFWDEHSWGSSAGLGPSQAKEQWEHKQVYALQGQSATKELLRRAWNRVAALIDTQTPSLYVFNSGLAARTESITCELRKGQRLRDATTGEVVPLDLVDTSDAVFASRFAVARFVAENVPPLGYKVYRVEQGETAPANKQEGWLLESSFYRLVLDPATGAIRELIDKETGRDLCDHSAPYGMNQLIYAKGRERTSTLSGVSDVRLIETAKTAYGARIRLQAKADSIPFLETEISIYDKLKRVDIVNRLSKQPVITPEALYFAFPFSSDAPQLEYQVQNAWVKMGGGDQMPGASQEWETTQNLVRVRGGGSDVLWSTPDAPLVTFTDIDRGMPPKLLTVKNGHVYSYVMNNYWGSTNYKRFQEGEATFRYSITSGRSIPVEAEVAFDESTRAPLLVYSAHLNENWVAHGGPLPGTAASFLRVQAPGVALSAFKIAEDGRGLILRFRESDGQERKAVVESSFFRVSQAGICNGLEEAKSNLNVEKGRLEVPLRKNAFTTVRLIPGN